jgi:radical SAM protein with 4Fe4S-binding SPASM domain
MSRDSSALTVTFVKSRIRRESPEDACRSPHPDYQEEMRYFEEGRVYSLQIESTLSCRQGCRYCYAASSDSSLQELPGEDILALIDSAAEMEIRAIDWLGGDPLLRSDWYDLTEYALDRGLVNNIWSSGIPLADPATARRAVEVTRGGFISVHLDTLNPEIYRGMHAGDPETNIGAILEGVDTLQSLGKCGDEMINCIAFTRPIAGEDIRKTIAYFATEKGMRTCLTQICMAGLARTHPEWVPGIQEITEACRLRDAMNYPGSGVSMSTMDVTKFYCGGTVCVTVEGDVTPCSVIRRGFGNIHDLPFDRIVEESREALLFMPLRQSRPDRGNCGNCKQNTLCWGCRAAAYYVYGDMMADDPYCWRNEPRGI